MCDVMYKRRLKGYASVGYKIQQNDSKDLFGIGQGVIFNGKNYQNLFFADLSKELYWTDAIGALNQETCSNS